MEFYLLGVVGAYLLGSIPFGVVVSRFFGKDDLRTHGSHNIGFTNALRVSGKTVGILTLIGDLGKGTVATVVAGLMGFPWLWILVIGFSVILGHVFSVFLRFKGGKGVATALGAIIGIHPLIGWLLVGVWLGAVLVFGYSSGGALLAFGVFPFLVYFLTFDLYFCLFSLGVMAIIFISHKENILRLIQGTESKIRLFSI
ncbi:MAG: glycerol-3-phosphate 1-O-acyltransferase PlsY [Nitrospirales bacterium]|nr:glycerol-3-phosphate 1-O-acyltransferase PlsY [Nitrospirales bacterium]MBA3965409.1 glycerol-3-phosphate 1-O-acyltransferase PlsY [Nitrospirales bacterium]